MKNVMIVDDEALVLLDLVHTVEDLGYNVHSDATSLSGAFAALEQSEPDVALLDIDVAGEPVWPVARTLTERNIPVIFISANLSHAQLTEEFGGCPTLEKPASPRDIAEALRKFDGPSSCAA